MAGPVCAAAVVLPPDFPVGLLADSKKLKPGERDEARRAVVEGALAWGVGWATHSEIDELNILRATLLAMRRAFDCLFTACGPETPETEAPFGKPLAIIPPGLRAVVDGTHIPDLPIPCEALVKADSKVPQVMAASILAKTARDRLMEHYAGLYPQYGYDRHKGYPTVGHREMVLKYGPSPIQRKSFRVCKG